MSDTVDALPRRSAAVHAVDAAGDRVLYDHRSGRLHTLNGSAALIWDCLDGATPLDDLVSELSEVFAADPVEIRTGVVEVIDRLTEEGLVDGAPAPEATDRPPATELEPPCVPCAKKLDAEPWASTTELTVGRHAIRVRTNTAEATATLRRLFAPYAGEERTDLPHYSVVLGQADGATRALHRLHYTHRLRVRTRSEARVWRALAAHLGAHLDDERTDQLLVSARLLVRGDEAVVLPPDAHLESAEPRLARHGIAVLDAPSVAVAAPDGVVVLPAGIDVLDGAGLDDERGSELPQPEPGPRRIAAWFVRAGMPGSPLAPALALGQLLRVARNVDSIGADVAVDRLAAIGSTVPMGMIDDGRPDGLVTQALAAFGEG